MNPYYSTNNNNSNNSNNNQTTTAFSTTNNFPNFYNKWDYIIDENHNNNNQNNNVTKTPSSAGSSLLYKLYTNNNMRKPDDDQKRKLEMVEDVAQQLPTKLNHNLNTDTITHSDLMTQQSRPNQINTAMEDSDQQLLRPPKKKPGRKPSTNTAISKRKAQNRAAQRAFRERKDRYVKDLEVKVKELVSITTKNTQENQQLKILIDQLQAENFILKQTNFTFEFPLNNNNNNNNNNKPSLFPTETFVNNNTMVTSSDDQDYKPKTAPTSHQNQPSSAATTNNNVTDSFIDPYTPPSSSNSSDDESASSPKSLYETENSTTVNNNNNHRHHKHSASFDNIQNIQQYLLLSDNNNNNNLLLNKSSDDFLLPAYKLNFSNHQGENKSTNTKRPSVERTRSSSEPIPYSAASYEPSLLMDVKPNKIVHAKPQNAEEFCKKFLDNDDGDDCNQQDSSLSDIINIIKEEKDPNVGLTLPPTPTTATFAPNNREYNSNSTVQQLTPFTETLPPLPPLFEENFRNFGSFSPMSTTTPPDNNNNNNNNTSNNVYYYINNPNGTNNNRNTGNHNVNGTNNNHLRNTSLNNHNINGTNNNHNNYHNKFNNKKLLSCSKLWERIQQHPKFDDLGGDEIDRLCSELKAKAKCSANGGLRVLAEDELEAVLVKLEKNN